MKETKRRASCLWSVCMSIVLAVGMCPTAAFASEVDDPGLGVSDSANYASIGKSICEPSKSTSFSDFQVKSIDGATTKFNTHYKDTLRIVVMGELASEVTAKTVSSLEKLLSQQEYENLQGFVFCMEAAEENAFVSKYKDASCKNIVFAVDGDSYHELLCDAYEQAELDDRSAAELPYIFFVDAQNTIRFAATSELTEQDMSTALDELIKQQPGEVVPSEGSMVASGIAESSGANGDTTSVPSAENDADEPVVADSQGAELETADEAQNENEASPLASEDEFVSGNFRYTLYDGNYVKIIGYVNKPAGPTLVIPEKLDGHIVETIGGDAFRGCSGFSSISFPSTLAIIEGNAFNDCDGLTEVSFPKYVEAIHGGSFADCDKLSKIALPQGGDGCFLGSNSFADDPLLTSLFIPDGLRCDNVWTGSPFARSPISSVTFESGITSIPGNILGRCTSLKDIAIPSTVVTIGYSAFSGCTSLGGVKFPDSLETIEAGAFYDCDSLTEVTFPNSVEVIGGDISNFNNGSFADCDNLSKITLPRGNVGCLLGGNAFSNDPLLKSVFIPKGIHCDTYWYFGAFPGSGLEEVTFEKGIDTIPENLFKNCNSLAEVTVPETVKVIKNNAFKGCSALTTVSLPSGLQKIEGNAFEFCERLTSVTLPDSLAEIGPNAFSDCEKLASLKLPSSAEGCTIYSRAFSNCTRLTSVHIPKSLRLVGPVLSSANPFAESGIASVTFENGIGVIPAGLFGECKNLASINLPETVEEIGEKAFIGCDALTAVGLPKSLKKIGNSTFENCDRLVSVTVPENVSEIEGYAFCDCPKLEKVHIPYTTSKIGYGVFSGSPKAYIEGYKTSYAETYAKENDITFEALPLPFEMKYAVLTSIEDQVYTGSALLPALKVTFEGKALVKDADYTLSYKNNTNVGTATVTVVGKGKFSGTTTATFRIVKANIEQATVAAVPNQEYTGKSIEPKPVVSYNGVRLKEGTDYTLSYWNNDDIGTGTITITGKGGLTGTKTVSFEIVAVNIEKKISVSSIADITYTGEEITPCPVVKIAGKTLTEGKDYDLSYKNNLDVGTATVSIEGIDYYAGRKTVTFKIVAASMAKATVGKIEDQAYTGKKISPKPVVKNGWQTLEEGTDYTLSYANNVRAGTATVTIVGKGNYAGTKSVSFRIIDKPKPPTPTPAPAPTTPRLAGDTALDTMASITKQGFEAGSCSTVVVATMGGYWDALSASALAGLNDCPILLTDGSTLSSQTAAEIKRLNPSKVYIAGGTAAISSNVESALKSIAGVKTVKRLAGSIAVNTALEIYKEGKGSWGSTAIVATSETFQDALSVSPYAYAKRAPIFLANASTHKLDPNVLTELKAGGFTRVIIVGGTAALSDQLEKQQLKGISCKRLAGATAYETSGAIAAWCLTQGMTAAHVGVATGDSYYDALAGAALCGKNNSALVLVTDSNRSNITGFVASHKKAVSHVYIFGGSAAVSTATYNTIKTVLR